MDSVHNITEPRRLMPIRQVAAAFQVSPASIRRWAGAGVIPSFQTLGGHLRFYADEIEPLAIESTTSRAEAG